MPERGTVPYWPEPVFLDRPDGYRLAFFETGPPIGRPVVLCHGLAASSLQFVREAEALGNLGFRVIVPDLRGHGRSVCPGKRADAAFSMDMLAADLVVLLDHLRTGPVDWVGNSLGGILALRLMGTCPWRIKSLATYGTAFSLNVPSWIIPLGRLGFFVLGKRLTARIGGLMTTRNRSAQPVIARMLYDMDVDAVLRIGDAVRRYDMIENALGFEGRILVMRGSRDEWVNKSLPKTLKRMEKKRRGFVLVDIEGAGHVANQDQPEAFMKALLDFLGPA